VNLYPAIGEVGVKQVENEKAETDPPYGDRGDVDRVEEAVSPTPEWRGLHARALLAVDHWD
jgi:hypothetical protein